MEPRVIRRSESHLSGARGDTLFRRDWVPEEALRALLVVHGYAEHSGRYETFGSWFAERGCAVHGYDHLGHGRSAGRRCHVTAFADFLDDLDLLLESVAGVHPGIPVFLVGHSMGGLIVAAHLRERQPDVAGAALSGAALRVSGAVPAWQLRGARLLRRVVPRLRMESRVDASGLSRDPAVVEAYLSDPLVERHMTISLACELLDAAERTLSGAADVRVPVLVMHGGDDPLCAPSGSEAFHAGLAVADKELRLYPGLRHEIFNEPDREQVFSDLLRWCEARGR